jgi:hypothetical protein
MKIMLADKLLSFEALVTLHLPTMKQKIISNNTQMNRKHATRALVQQ